MHQFCVATGLTSLYIPFTISAKPGLSSCKAELFVKFWNFYSKNLYLYIVSFVFSSILLTGYLILWKLSYLKWTIHAVYFLFIFTYLALSFTLFEKRKILWVFGVAGFVLNLNLAVLTLSMQLHDLVSCRINKFYFPLPFLSLL